MVIKTILHIFDTALQALYMNRNNNNNNFNNPNY